MSLNDVLRVKRIADNISFVRLFFLKSTSAYNKARIGSKDSGLELVDCIVAIFLFEITRATRTNSFVDKENLNYKILHFFHTLKVQL